MRKYKLKKKYRRVILYIVIVLILVLFGINRYKTYQYHRTYEYKLLQVGYNEKIVKNILNILGDKEIDILLNREKIEYVDKIINEKYFLKKNFEEYISYYNENQKYSFKDVVALVNVGANKEWYTNTNITDTSKGKYILVNKFHMLPEDYDAGVIKKFSSTYAYGTVKAEEECYNQFISMAKDAKKDGITLVLSSGYRERSHQSSLYNSTLKSKGEEYADKYAARAGSSEHETGLALDILSTGKGAYTNNFHETEAYAWLIEHAENYGFILRYPEGKEYITGYSPESWHYRYLGVDLAKKINKEGITFDEYYAYYLE